VAVHSHGRTGGGHAQCGAIASIWRCIGDHWHGSLGQPVDAIMVVVELFILRLLSIQTKKQELMRLTLAEVVDAPDGYEKADEKHEGKGAKDKVKV